MNFIQDLAEKHKVRESKHNKMITLIRKFNSWRDRRWKDAVDDYFQNPEKYSKRDEQSERFYMTICVIVCIMGVLALFGAILD